MTLKVLILGASYGSLLGTKMLMAGHDVTLVCREKTAALINAEGTEVRLRLRGEDALRSIRSQDQPGRLDAMPPEAVDVARYDMVGLAMQEPQYRDDSIRQLLRRTADARLPCLSIMNMPPLPFLKRIPALDTGELAASFACPEAWEGFDPELVTLCSPDPQAFRPPDEPPNVLQVGLPTNFKAAAFGDAAANAKLAELEASIAAVRLEGKDVPVKLRVDPSIFVPLAKWSMLLAGNYRCITEDGVRPIREAVHGDLAAARRVYGFVDELARRLGAQPEDQVPFEKYARAAADLTNPSSVARAVASGATAIERVDKLVQLIGRELGLEDETVDHTVEVIDARLLRNQQHSEPANLNAS